MKIAHIADIHIGSGRAWFSDLQSNDAYYLRRHKICLTEIIEKIVKEKIKYVILAGDLLDHARPLPKETELLGWFLHSLSEVAEVHIIAGNHEDLWTGMTTLHPISILTLSNQKLHWHLELGTTDEPFGKVLWASHNHTKQIITAIGTDTPEYVVAHYAAKGCLYENGMIAPKGYTFDYGVGTIKRWFIGDIHLRQQLAANASYPGSPLQVNFGDSGSKGFDIYDTETGKIKQISLLKAPPLMTEYIKDKLPEFNENALYRVFVPKDFLSHTFPSNVVSVQLVSKKMKDDATDKEIIVEDIDFGDPLTGLEDTLKRTKLPEQLYEEARQVASAL